MSEETTYAQNGLPGWRLSAGAAISCVSITGVTFGLGLPLLAFNLEFMTGSGTIIALNALMAALSTVIAAPFAPALLARVPTRPFLVASLLYTAATFVAYKLVPSVPFWMFLRFTSGIVIAVLFVASEAWIVQLAPDQIRGRVLGIYSIALSAGFGIGGLIVAILGVRGWAPFIAGAGICLVATLPLLLPGPGLHIPEKASAGIREIIGIARRAPRLMVAALAFGAIETSAMHFMPIWAFRSGFAETQAQLLIAAGAVGVILLQLPLGWLGDFFDRYRLMLICAFAGIFGPALMYLAGVNHSPAIYLVFFFYVGLIEAIYILALAIAGQRFKTSEMTTASAALVTMYGLGSLSSPVLVGPLMDAINPHGALIGLLLVGLIYPLTALVRRNA
jgi:MFS family permease